MSIRREDYLAKLRAKTAAKEPEKVITVRLPKSMLEALKHQAHEHETSLNKYCIELLQVPLVSMLNNL
jgi:predicted HicB family RNase H-like nuclease